MAKKDMEEYLKQKPNDSNAKKNMQQIASLEEMMKQALFSFERNEFENVLELTSSLLQHIKLDKDIFLLRVQCQTKLKQYYKVIEDGKN